jgi:hypothetical protein
MRPTLHVGADRITWNSHDGLSAVPGSHRDLKILPQLVEEPGKQA